MHNVAGYKANLLYITVVLICYQKAKLLLVVYTDIQAPHKLVELPPLQSGAAGVAKNACTLTAEQQAQRLPFIASHLLDIARAEAGRNSC